MKNNKKYVLIFLALAVVVGMIIYEFIAKNEGSINRNSDISIKYDAGVKADFYTRNKNVFYLTKDGLQMINNKGESVWSDTFNMANPYMITDSGIIAVMEKNGRVLKVYNEKGAVSNINTDNPIASASLDNKGDICVISKGDTYYLSVYNQSGEKIFDGNFASDDGLPVCSDISDDGKILAVSFLDISDIKVKSRVCFYYIGDNSNGINQEVDSDYMFASYIEEDAVVGILSFLEGNNLAALSDKSLALMSLNPTGNEKYRQTLSYELNNKVTAVDFSNKKTLSLALGEAVLNSQNAEKENTVKWFNYRGNEIGSYEAEKDVTSLKLDFDATIISMDRQFVAVDNKCSEIWKYNAIQDVKNMFFLSSTQDVLLVASKEAYSVNINGKLNEEKMAEDDTENIDDNSDDIKEAEAEKDDIRENSEAVTENITAAENKTAITTQKQAEKNVQAETKNQEEKADENNVTEKVTEKATEKETENDTEKVTEKPVEETTKKVEEVIKTEETQMPKENNDNQGGPIMPE